MKKTVETPGHITTAKSVNSRAIPNVSTYAGITVSPILTRTIAQTPANESAIRGHPIHQGTAIWMMEDNPEDFVQALKAGLLVVV